MDSKDAPTILKGVFEAKTKEAAAKKARKT